MKLRLILFALVALLASPALAQDNVTHTVSFDGFTFSYDSSIAPNVNISLFAGDPPDLQQPGGAEVAHTQFSFYSQPPAPESLFDSAGGLRVYRTADFAGYEFPAQQLQHLQTLLADRPDLTQFMESTGGTAGNTLPFMPVFPAGQVIRARAQYVDTASVSGVSYITVFRQDASPLVGSELLYTFQGLSADGAQYVAAIFRLNTALIPSEIPADFDYETFIEEIDQYMADTVATLNGGTADDFTPSLTTLDALIQAISFTTTGAPPPEVTETPDSGDLAGSGLAGVTWTLFSYGDPSSPQSMLPNAPITLTFAETGVAGSAGCNQYSGSFQFDNDALTVGELITTRIACEEAVMTQETAYIAALQAAASFAISDGQLQIVYDGGVLTFTSGSAGADLGGLTGTWTLVSYGDPNNPQPVVGTTPVTLTVAPDGASGNGGCNQYGTGTVVVENNTVRFGQIISTLMACADENVTAQETAYLGALQSATSFAITDGQLQIFYDGGVLNFTAA